jgi:mannitol-specific phosphotransferase system IIBC component
MICVCFWCFVHFLGVGDKIVSLFELLDSSLGCRTVYLSLLAVLAVSRTNGIIMAQDMDMFLKLGNHVENSYLGYLLRK